MKLLSQYQRRSHALIRAWCLMFSVPALGAAPGALDPTFNENGKLVTAIGVGSDQATSVALQRDGKIVAAGRGSNGTETDVAIVRYHTDGRLDTSFGGTGIVTTSLGTKDDGANKVVIQSDGKLVCAGYAGVFADGRGHFAVVRYNQDGSLDTSFNGTGKVVFAANTYNDRISDVVIQGDGKILVGGYSADGITFYNFTLARFNRDGTLDTNFNGTGKVITDIIGYHDFANAIALQGDGKIVAAGHTGTGSNGDFALVRYSTNGSLDTSFGVGGIVTTAVGSGDDVCYGVAIQPDGKIVCAGAASNGIDDDFALVRYNPNGTLDSTFNGNGKVTTAIGNSHDIGRGVTIQENGQILVVGYSRNGNTEDFAVARYNGDGSLDTSFNGTGATTTSIGDQNDQAKAIVCQSDGKVIVGGHSFNGANDDFAVVRYEGAPEGASLVGVNTHRAEHFQAQKQCFSALDSPSLSITGDLTIEAWVKFRSFTGSDNDTQFICGKYEAFAPSNGRSYALIYNRSEFGGFLLRVNPNGGTIPDTVGIWPYVPVLGQWNHIAAAFDCAAHSATLYVNGVSLGTMDTGAIGSIADTSVPFQIGNLPDYANLNRAFDGSIDEVRVWAVTRTAEEIRASMFSQLEGGEAGLRGYWKLNGSLVDASGNFNTLTPINGTTFSARDLPFSNSSLALEFCPDKDTVALYHLDSNVDSGPSEREASTATASYESGRFGKGAAFAGSTRFLASGFLGQTVASYAFWLRLAAPSVGGCLFSFDKPANGGKHSVTILSGGNLRFSIYRSSPFVSEDLDTAGLDLRINKWYCVVVTVSATEARIYVNGILFASRAITQIDVGQELTIGSNRSDASCINGRIDEFNISGRAWSPEEIIKYYGGIVSAGYSVGGGGGNVYGVNTDYSVARSQQNGVVEQGGNPDFQYKLEGGVYTVDRLFLPFDTGDLPDGGIAFSDATLYIRPSGASDQGGQSIHVVSSTQASETALVVSDYQRLSSASLGATQLQGMSGGVYNGISLNVSSYTAICCTGSSKLGLRYSGDLSGQAPIGMSTLDNVDFSASKPFIHVEYRQLDSGTRFVRGAVSILGNGSGTGTIRVMASPISPDTAGTATLSSPGAYLVPGLRWGTKFDLMAYLDEDDDGARDPLEWTGDYPGNPLLIDSDRYGIDIVIAPPADTDSDGLPDAWEAGNGLNVGMDDAALDKDGDGLTNLQELWLSLRADDSDTDDDGVFDSAEVNIHGTNASSEDSDGDGLPDKWEIDHGLDPRRNDAGEDQDFDFLSNEEEFNGGVNSTDPSSSDSDGDGVRDFVQRHGGQSTWQALYDRDDRLLGVRDARGASFAYRYDGNGNPIRQAKLGFDTDGDGMSDLWEFANGLDPSSRDGVNGGNGDPDGDGWSNWQEQDAGSDPGSTNSTPNTLGPPGTILVSWSPGFTPSNFVMASGQMDGIGADEIVVGADGDPAGQTNSVLILSRGGTNWAAHQVDIGPVGITSLAVGRLTNRPSAAAYIGTRGSAGGANIMEVAPSGGVWCATAIPFAAGGTETRVIGVRSNGDLVVESADVGSSSLILRALECSGGVWQSTVLSAATNSRGLGILEAKSGWRDGTVWRPVDPTNLEWSGASDLTVLWPFDDGTAVDLSGNAVNGIVYGATVAAGHDGAALYFDGTTNKSVRCPSFSMPSNDLTIAFWTKCSASPSGAAFVSYANSDSVNALLIYGPSALDIEIQYGATESHFITSCDVGDGAWHHVTLTRQASSGAMRIYKDGILAGSTNMLPGKSIGTGGYLVLAQDQDVIGGGFHPNQSLSGGLDGFQVYDRVLTDDQVESLVGSSGSRPMGRRVFVEPSAAARLLWRSQCLTDGNPGRRSIDSGFYAFIDDKDASGSASEGDDWVVSEFSSGRDGDKALWTRRRALSQPFGNSYGLTCVNLLDSSSSVLLAAEPGGKIYSWVGTNGAIALDCKVFSSQHIGKHWHQLGSVAGVSGGEGLVGLLVDPTVPASCNVIFWEPIGSLPNFPEPSQTEPVASVMVSSNTLGGSAALAVRVWDAEGNPSAVAMQFSTNGGVSWGPATIMSLDGQPYSPSAFVEAQPGGTTHAAVWNARADAGSGYQGTVLLRAQARDMSGAGAWSGLVAYSMMIDVADLDVSMGDSPDPVTQGEELTYSLTVQNGGPTEALGVIVDVALPGGVTFGSVVASQGSCTPSGGSVQCDLGTLANGASATISIKVRTNAAGEIEASAMASHAGTDPAAGNNTASATTTVNGSDQLAVTPEVMDIGGVVFGGYGDGVFTLSNKGPSSVSGSAAVPAGVFEILSGSPYDLAGYSAAEVVVRFTPSGAGSFAEDVIFESNGGTRTNRVIGVGGDLPAPDFTASPTDGAAPLAVLFTDLTSASVTNRVWDFGDGSSLATSGSNTVYVYQLPGTNTVTLTVQGPGGSSSVTKSNLIVVAMYPPGDVNGDGRVTGADSLLINQALVPPGLRQTNDAIFAKAGFQNGDVNQDGQVTGADSLRINQVMVQLRSFVVTRMMPSWRSNSALTAVAVYGIGFPTQAVSGVTIGPPVSLSLSNVTAISREEIRGVVPGGGGTGTGTVSVIAFPSNSVISTGTFENR